MGGIFGNMICHFSGSTVKTMINVACINDSNAYLPELHAYREYFQDSKTVRFAVLGNDEAEKQVPGTYDLMYRFMGFCPAWQHCAVPEIHEYHSLSVPPLAQMKDKIKRYANRKPVGRVFLNRAVEETLGFSDEVPGILRDMGVHRRFFEVAAEKPVKEFDIVYCGTVSGRPGLFGVIRQCLEDELSVLVVGKLDDEAFLSSLGSLRKGLAITGPVPYDEVPGWIGKARFGLNFIPDIYPFNVQTSTKVLEYCAAGLGVVTNDYAWVRHFEADRQASFYRIESGFADLRTMSPAAFSGSVDSLEWSALLERCGLEGFLVSCASSTSPRSL